MSFKKKQQSIPVQSPATEKASNIENKEAQATTAPKTTGETATTEKEQEKAESAKPNSLQAMISSQYQKLGRLVTRGRGPLLPLLTLGLI